MLAHLAPQPELLNYTHMETNSIYELLAMIVGPVAAVLITLGYGHLSRQREQKTVLLRMLSATRGLPADINHSTALTLVPIEYSKADTVIRKHSAYVAEIRKKDSEGRLLNPDEALNKYIDLLESMFRHLGYKYDHEAIRNHAVLTDGFVERDTLYLNSLKATTVMASHLQRSADASERTVRILEESAAARGDERSSQAS